MKKGLIGLLLVLGLIPWLVAMVCLWLSTWMARLGDRISPGLMYGNCWSYALPKFARHGGYLLVRPARGIRLLKMFSVPHVIWVKRLPCEGVELEMFQPIDRDHSSWLPWKTIWYKGQIKRAEKAGRYAARGVDASGDA